MFRSTSNPGQDLDSSTPVSKKVQEITGVTLEWEFPVGDFKDQELRVLRKRGGQVEQSVATLCRFVPLRGGEGWH